MFVAKLFLVLLIVNASVCSKHEQKRNRRESIWIERSVQRTITMRPIELITAPVMEPVEVEYVDPVVEHHGPALNENCILFRRDPCPVENYPSMARLHSPRVRSLDDVLQIIRETPLEDFCRDLPAGYSCAVEAILSEAEVCIPPAQRNALVAMLSRELGAIEYLCEEEIENIKTHINCFTTNELVSWTYRCISPLFGQGRCKAYSVDQAIQCASGPIDRMSSCQEGAKEVFQRIAFRLAEAIQPCAMLEESRNWTIPSMFKFSK